jgi:hypothetical protein
MTRRRESIRLGSHWHVDCRLEAELPDDSVVGARFAANLLFGSIAVATLLFAGWLGYINVTARQNIRHWERQIAENLAEVRVIQGLQREYVAEASKIDQAYGTIRPAIYVSDFVAGLGRKLPPEITVESVEWNDTGVVVRGYVREPVQKAADVLGGFVAALKKDSSIAPNFQDIRPFAMERVRGNDEIQNFGLRFILKPLEPL